MKQQRERVFFAMPAITAWRFAGINILHMLWLQQDKKPLHGRYLKQLMAAILGDAWLPGNDLLYTILNTYEQEGYVRSKWQESEDNNKRYIRYYWITDSGIGYLKTIKAQFLQDMQDLLRILDTSLLYIWKDSSPQPPADKPKPVSSRIFTQLNVMTLLKETNTWLHAKEIKSRLTGHYSLHWEPSDGMLYPLLSQMEQKGLLESRWEEGGKKRTTREYRLTEEGLKSLELMTSPGTGYKNKIIQFADMCRRSKEFLYGDSLETTTKIKMCG
jgi:DNA-binding PadR family transcriptional regulator